MKLTVSLNGNLLCPFQVFIDINSQLSNPVKSINEEAFKPICDLNTINDWINLESLGKPPAIKAKALSESLYQQLMLINEPIELHVQLLNYDLTVDNLYALLFLTQSLSSISLYFYVHSEKLDHLKKTITPLFETNNLAIHFSDKKIDGDILEASRNQLLKEMGFNFDFYQNNNAFSPAELSQLIGYAWVCHKAGAYELGTNALALALTTPAIPKPLHETLFMQLQLTRFLSHQYEAVTQAQYPDTFYFLKEEDVISLHFITAYSATLTRNLSVAALHFQKCNVNEHMELTGENSLYRLNLFALYLVLNNKADISMKLELQIQDYIDEHQINVVGLKYVNFINIARLYKKFKQYNEALSYYSKAYNEISGCGYTPSDHIYFNMNLGSLNEAAGNPKTALQFWIKAAIHWLSYENKYALSWRPRLILCQEKITDILRPLSVDKANQFLHEKIEDLIVQSGLQLPQSTLTPFVFKTQQTERNETCYASKDLVLYAGLHSSLNESTFESMGKLNVLVTQFIKQTMNIKNDHQTLRIDIQNEFYPQSAEHCWILATLAECNTCYYNNHLLNFDANQTEHMLDDTLITFASSIILIDPISRGFKLLYNRSFLNKIIEAADEVEFISQLQRKKQMFLSQLDFHRKRTLASLIRKKVIMIVFPPRSDTQSERISSMEYA